MRRRKRNKRSIQIVIGSVICLLLIMTVGYAAFSTNLTITAKGNIKEITAAWQLRKNVVTTGDGLYMDEYETGRYVYRGKKPNNFLLFNDELWKILSVETDNTLKILSMSSINISFDSAGNRTILNNTYCTTPETSGCNIWAKTEGTFVGVSGSGTVTEDASINTYLNTIYYNSLSDAAKQWIVNHRFNYGPISDKTKGVAELKKFEEKYKWFGLVGLPNFSDYYNASISEACRSSSPYLSWLNTEICITNNNYLASIKTWTINAEEVGNERSVLGGEFNYNYVGNRAPALQNLTSPALFLKSNVKLTGTGTETDPYIIK